MRDWENDAQNRRRPRGGSGKQALVVRHADEEQQVEDILERLERLETSPKPAKNAKSDHDTAQTPKFELKTMVAIAAILLSITGYVIEDARNASRQDAEIESTQVRVTNLEKIASANTEARIRTEVQLGELREGQQEIKAMLRAHDDLTLKALRKR